MEDNLKSLEITFSAEQLRGRGNVSAVPLGSPHDRLSSTIEAPLFGGMRDQIMA